MSINEQIRNLERQNFITKPLNRPVYLNPFLLKSKTQLYSDIANSGGFGDTETQKDNNVDSLLNKIRLFLSGRRRSPSSRRRSPDSRRRSPSDSRRRSPDSRRQSPDSRRRSSRRRVDPNYRDPDFTSAPTSAPTSTPTSAPTEAEIKEYVSSIRQSDFSNKKTTWTQSGSASTDHILGTPAHSQELENELENKRSELDLARHVQLEVYTKPEDRRSIKGFKRIREMGDDENVIYKSFKGFKNQVIWGIRGSHRAEDFIVDAQILGQKHISEMLPSGWMKKRFNRVNAKYLEIRNEFPNASVIMAGHSLGNSLGLEILKNNKNDNALKLFGFNGWQHPDYLESDKEKYNTLKVEGDFVSWVSDNKHNIIELIEHDTSIKKLYGTLGVTVASIAGVFYMKELAEGEMINMERLVGLDPDLDPDTAQMVPDDLIDEIADTMSEANQRSIATAIDAGETHYRTPETDIKRDSGKIQELLEAGDPRAFTKKNVDTSTTISKYDQLTEFSENVNNYLQSFIITVVGLVTLGIFGLYQLELHSANHFKPKNPKWIKKTKKTKKIIETQKVDIRNQYATKYDYPDEL
jgi:hypothetical protein